MSQSVQSNIHIQLSNSKSLRREILESAMFANKMQQAAIRIKELQLLKKRRIEELKQQIDEIEIVSKALHLKEFPQFKDKEEKIEVAKEKKERPIIPSRQ